MLSQNIIDYLYNHDQVSAAWLCRSVAQGRERQDSDIDIAILFVPGLTRAVQFNLRLALAVDLTAIAGREVDVADMISATPFLASNSKEWQATIRERPSISDCIRCGITKNIFRFGANAGIS